ncbi:hypothetical protein [Hymenobacter guriensis]|uniref:Uncharacterized protein n=1 Tax=Hymenobacter guriensis TaxID=2793065 RepID=A0ABS0KW83_9BACT|nr:hypothetical protein [Hymenobacter guriensis]MBG8552102.1 hypothetical protein [Hymenobacter guriensis]
MADKDYSKADLLAHYRVHQPQLTALRAYYDSLVPHNQHIEIEFEQDSVSRLGFGTPGMNYLHYHAGADKRVTLDSVVQAYGWTPAQVRKLAEKLKQAGCISIRNGEPAQIGFQRSGMSRYSYHVFSQPLSDSLRKEYQGVWLYRFVHDKVALEKGGGAT